MTGTGTTRLLLLSLTCLSVFLFTTSFFLSFMPSAHLSAVLCTGWAPLGCLPQSGGPLFIFLSHFAYLRRRLPIIESNRLPPSPQLCTTTRQPPQPPHVHSQSCRCCRRRGCVEEREEGTRFCTCRLDFQNSVMVPQGGGWGGAGEVVR